MLEEVSAEGSQVVQIENSVESPQETITETLSAGVVPNANYSVVVFAKTHTWNSSTAPHNFSECIRMLGGVIIADTAYVRLVPLHCFALSVCTSHEQFIECIFALFFSRSTKHSHNYCNRRWV